MFLGERWRVLDPITSLVVGIFIFGVAYKLARPSIQELLEMSLPEEVEQNIAEKIQQTPGVIAFHHLRTRKNGNTFIIDMHIKVDPDSFYRQSARHRHTSGRIAQNHFREKDAGQYPHRTVFAKKLSDTDTILSFFSIFVFKQSLINCF